MKLDLEVLTSTSIKRKKPWPRIIWIGEEQESLLLLDAPGKRISVLYVPSGKTRRKLPKLSILIEQVVAFGNTKNARYLLGFLHSWELFVWHKDKDIVKYIPGLQMVCKSNVVPEHVHISASDDCEYVFVAFSCQEFYVWIMDRSESVLHGRNARMKGSWYVVPIPQGMDLPSHEAAESTVAAVYIKNAVLGSCFQCSVVFNKQDMLSIATLVLKFPDTMQTLEKSVYSSEWSLLQYPYVQMHPDFQPISSRGAYVADYCPVGQVLALAANQNSPSKTAMLFVSPLTDTVLVGNLKGCGASDPNRVGRQYWVNDLSWTADSLFVSCMMRNGSVCLVPRLGEPLPIQTKGCSVDMGPALYLPLHPAMMITSNQLQASLGPVDPLQQQFSVSCHPSLPILLYSDGFLVTLLQLPVEMTSVMLMKDLVLESAKFLKKLYQQENLDMTAADAYKLSKGQKDKHHSKNIQDKKRQYEFEMAEISLNATQNSEISMIETGNQLGLAQFGAVGDLDAGKIVFGEPEMINIDLNATLSGLEASEALLKYLEESMSALTSVWKLAVSYTDVWTSEVDNIVKQAVHNLSKIFTVVLDCPAVEAIIPVLTPRQSTAIQNPRVYNIIVAYRNLLQLLRFDTFNQHLIPVVLKLVHKTITVMLQSPQLDGADPRLKTLFGCYSLIKHAESCLNRVYGWMSVQEKPVNSTNETVEPEQALPGRRLASTWRLLYNYVLQHQSQIASVPDARAELPHLEKLIGSILQELQDTDHTPRQSATKLTAADKLSVDGEHDKAMSAWRGQLQKLAGHKKDSPRTAKMLHSMLYTHLLNDELSEAVEFIDTLILQARVDSGLSSQELMSCDYGTRPPLMTMVSHRSQDSEEEEMVPCIRNKSIRKTVQTLARYMAAYFTNSTMFIYPPHNAQPLPCLPFDPVPTKVRIIPKYHEEVTNTVTRLNLGSVWTTERVVEYLLLSGLVCETSWFAYKMGDWKSAFLLSVAHCSHVDVAAYLYQKGKKPLELASYLQPMSLLQEKLQILLRSGKMDEPSRQQNKAILLVNDDTNLGQLTRTLHDMLTTGLVCGVDLAPWLLTSLTNQLKAVATRLSALIPQGFYLPAPPLYCPQPTNVDMHGVGVDVQYEMDVRQELSSIIQLVLVILQAAQLSLPAARWYVQELFKVQERAAQFKATTEGPCLELPEVLQQYKIVRSDISECQEDGRVGQVLSSFRDVCAILWMLHVRDELSLQLRKRGTRMSNEQHADTESQESTLGTEYIQQCFHILKLAVNMLTFTKYLGEDSCLRKVILSLILELPATEDTADILAEHFYASETYDSEVQERLEKVVNMWQSVEIQPEDDGKSARLDNPEEGKQNLENEEEDDEDGSVRKSVTFYQASPRAKTLSVYFHKQCDVVMKVLKKKRKLYGLYEEFVFLIDSESETTVKSHFGSRSKVEISVGARPYETRHSYFEFLDRFFAISFTKVIEQETENGRTPMYPILMPFTKVIREAEFKAFISKNDESYKKKTSSVVMASPRAKILRSQSEPYVMDSPDSKNYSPSHQKKNFFASNRSMSVQQPGKESTGKGMSPSKNKVNMTGMASRFFQSEDVLYPDASDVQDAHWILDVNFGQRYMALEQMLEYLQNWVRKQHSLGLPNKFDKELGVKPTMRIEVPTQLVVLSLWLLENKYSNVKRPKQVNESLYSSEASEQVLQQDQIDGKALATLEEVTEHESFTQVSNIPKSYRSASANGARSRSNSPGGNISRSKSAGFNMSSDRTREAYRSITSTQEETEQVKSAYKKVLDEGDDSSSLEVSSLEADDIDATRVSNSSSPGRKGRSRVPKHQAGVERSAESSPDNRDRSTLNHTLPFMGSPERPPLSAPKTSTPVRSPSRRGYRTEEMQQDLSRISVPPGAGILGNKTAPPAAAINPDNYRNGQINGNPAVNSASNQNLPGIPPGNNGPMGAQDLASQLQQIVRGELRKMMEVQHQSMMAMMGALDGQPFQMPAPNAGPFVGPTHSVTPHLGPSDINSGQPSSNREKPLYKDVLQELRNLEQTEGRKLHRGSKSPGQGKRIGKENIDLTLHMSDLDGRQEHIDLYRVDHGENDPNRISFFPKFLRVPAEKDDGVRFPLIPMQAWQSQDAIKKEAGLLEDMPLLHVERTVPAHIFPDSRRLQPLPHTPLGGMVQHAPPAPPARSVDSPDSGIGIPLLRIPLNDEPMRRQPRFGELLPPDQIEVNDKRDRAEKLRARYMEEFHKFQKQKTEDQVKQTFGEHLLQLREEPRAASPETSRRSPRKSPRKSPRQLSESEQLTSRSKGGKKKFSKRPKTPESIEADSEKSEERLASQKSKSASTRHSKRQERLAEGEEKEEEGEEEDTTAAESLADDDEGEVEEEEDVLHDGYVFPPGEFEAYLALEKQLAKTKDTHARIQLKTALRLQQQRLKENWKRPKVDFATNTQEYVDANTDPDYAMELASYRTSEKATSITKDTGVDPIQEAVIEYNKTRQANVLPPDIYMSLRFAQSGETTQGASQQESGRQYLNVVDLDASAVLNDLLERETPAEPSLGVTPLQQHLANRIGYEEGLQAAAGTTPTPTIAPPTRADQLTVRMFDTKVQGEDRFSMMVLPRDETDSKFLVMQKLRDMNSQLEAIDHMSRNMEREFKGTRLALHTLDEITNAMQPAEKPSAEAEDMEEVRPSRGSPVPSQKSPKHSTRTTSRSTAQSSARAKKSTDKSIEDEQSRRSVELSKMSGLSGISDIIQDMVAKGDIDLADVGMSRQHAKQLQQHLAVRHYVGEADVTLDHIRKEGGVAEKPSGRDREELQAWMIAKRQKQTEEYRRNLEVLRERESRPFKPKFNTYDKGLNSQALLEEREEVRKQYTREYMSKRLDEAQSLLGNILTDKPELPKEPPRRVSPQRRGGKDRSPVTRDRSPGVKDRSPVRRFLKSAVQLIPRQVSPSRKPTTGILKKRDVPYSAVSDEFDEEHLRKLIDDSDEFDMSDVLGRDAEAPSYLEPASGKPPGQPRPLPTPHRIDVSPVRSSSKKPAGIPRLSLGLEDVQEEPRLTTQASQDTSGLRQTVDTTGELADYYRAVEALDVTGSQDPVRDVASLQGRPLQPVGQTDTPKKQYKSKSFKDLVRLQRPHITRKQQPKISGLIDMDTSYQPSVSQVESARTTARTELTQREREMIHGSKRLPVKKPVSTTPRRVKTYAERLQEMKPKEKYSTPVAPRSHLGSSVASASARDSRQLTRVIKPKHKPMTYVEQLQKLNEGHHKPKMGQTTTVVQRPVFKSHKPAHKPKTYAEQLQELQPPKDTRGPPSKRPHMGPLRRSRPYMDPYKTTVEEDRESVISAWSMSDDVRNILYDNDANSYAVRPSVSYAPSEQVSDYYDAVMGDSYTASVDIDDLVRIADDGSISGGSIAEYIDWDQIDDLIADVQ